jgi:5-methylcytosine-specific restriction protein A
MIFYAPQDPKHLKKEREKARELKKSAWWNQKLQAGVCYYCENRFSKDDLTMDHKVPLGKGGTSSKNNIVCCCKECNSLKQSKTSVDFISS